MKRLLIAALFTAVVGLGASSALADEKVDVSAVITKADAEKILGVPVEDARDQNKESKDGFYDLEWSYYATKGDKAIFYHDKTGLEMMNILKGNSLITIGIHGMPGPAALEQEKAVATKILSHL